MKIYISNFKFIFIPLFTIYYLLFTIPPQATAQSPTPTKTETPTPTISQDDIKEKVQERIEQIKEQFKKRAFWGTLKEISNSTLVLDTPRGERMVKTDQETKFIGASQKEIKFADLEIGNFIIAMGVWRENGTLLGKRVVALAKPPKPAIRRFAVFGRVTDISKEEQILSLVHPVKKDTTYEVKITDKTIITKKVDGKIKKVNFGTIEVGDRLVAVGTKEADSGTLTAKLVHVIPGKAEGVEKQTTTPTPTTKTSPTPTKIKPSPTPTTLEE